MARVVHWTGLALIVAPSVALRLWFDWVSWSPMDAFVAACLAVSVHAATATRRDAPRYDPWALAACGLCTTAHYVGIVTLGLYYESGGRWCSTTEPFVQVLLAAFLSAGGFGAVSLLRILLTRGRLRGLYLAAFPVLFAPCIAWILAYYSWTDACRPRLGGTYALTDLDGSVPFVLIAGVCAGIAALTGRGLWRRWPRFRAVSAAFVLLVLAAGLGALARDSPFEAARSTHARLPFSRTAEPDLVAFGVYRHHVYLPPDGELTFGRSPETVIVPDRRQFGEIEVQLAGGDDRDPPTLQERLGWLKELQGIVDDDLRAGDTPPWRTPAQTTALAVHVDAGTRCRDLLSLVEELRAHGPARFHLAVRGELVPLPWDQWLLGLRHIVRDARRFFVELEPGREPHDLALGALDVLGFELDGRSLADRNALSAALESLRRDEPEPVLRLRPAPDATYARLVEVIDLVRGRVPGARLTF